MRRAEPARRSDFCPESCRRVRCDVAWSWCMLFVLLEWALAEWVKGQPPSQHLPRTSFSRSSLGISMRYIHLWVDRFVDRVFFRKRHEDERELRRFTHEAGFSTGAVDCSPDRASRSRRTMRGRVLCTREIVPGPYPGVDRERSRQLWLCGAWSNRVRPEERRYVDRRRVPYFNGQREENSSAPSSSAQSVQAIPMLPMNRTQSHT